MYRLVILSFLAVTALAADLDAKDCARKFHHHTRHCCKNNSEMKHKFMKTEGMKECFKLPKDPTSCEIDVCIAKIKGFATDDGKLDKTKLEEVVAKDIDDKELLADLKSNCFNGDLEKYGPPELCDFKKMMRCSTMQVLNHCPEWKDSDECNEIKEVVAECVKIMS